MNLKIKTKQFLLNTSIDHVLAMITFVFKQTTL